LVAGRASVTGVFAQAVDVGRRRARIRQGKSVEEARQNLVEAVELFYETAEPSEIAQRRRGDVLVTRLEVAVG